MHNNTCTYTNKRENDIQYNKPITHTYTHIPTLSLCKFHLISLLFKWSERYGIYKETNTTPKTTTDTHRHLQTHTQQPTIKANWANFPRDFSCYATFLRVLHTGILSIILKWINCFMSLCECFMLCYCVFCSQFIHFKQTTTTNTTTTINNQLTSFWQQCYY